jgi:hypothetical protein
LKHIILASSLGEKLTNEQERLKLLHLSDEGRQINQNQMRKAFERQAREPFLDAADVIGC